MLKVKVTCADWEHTPPKEKKGPQAECKRDEGRPVPLNLWPLDVQNFLFEQLFKAHCKLSWQVSYSQT